MSVCNITADSESVVLFVGSAGSYISGTALVVDGANYLYKKPDVPVDVVLKASRGDFVFPPMDVLHIAHETVTCRSELDSCCTYPIDKSALTSNCSKTIGIDAHACHLAER